MYAPGTLVVTQYGEGSVCDTRSDGIVVVQLHNPANGIPYLGFFNATSITWSPQNLCNAAMAAAAVSQAAAAAAPMQVEAQGGSCLGVHGRAPFGSELAQSAKRQRMF